MLTVAGVPWCKVVASLGTGFTSTSSGCAYLRAEPHASKRTHRRKSVSEDKGDTQPITSECTCKTSFSFEQRISSHEQNLVQNPFHSNHLSRHKNTRHAKQRSRVLLNVGCIGFRQCFKPALEFQRHLISSMTACGVWVKSTQPLDLL